MKKSSLVIAALLTVLSATQLSVAFAEDASPAAPATTPDTDKNAPAPDAAATDDDTTAPADTDS